MRSRRPRGGPGSSGSPRPAGSGGQLSGCWARWLIRPVAKATPKQMPSHSPDPGRDAGMVQPGREVALLGDRGRPERGHAAAPTSTPTQRSPRSCVSAAKPAALATAAHRVGADDRPRERLRGRARPRSRRTLAGAQAGAGWREVGDHPTVGREQLGDAAQQRAPGRRRCRCCRRRAARSPSGPRRAPARRRCAGSPRRRGRASARSPRAPRRSRARSRRARRAAGSSGRGRSRRRASARRRGRARRAVAVERAGPARRRGRRAG